MSSEFSPPPLPIVKRRRIGIVPAYIAVVLVLGLLGISVFSNERFGWPVVIEYLFNQSILRAIGMTIFLTIISMVIGIVLGVVLAIMRQSPRFLLSASAGLYIWFFRGTPVLVQLIFWYNLGALYPMIAFGVPFGPELFSIHANDLMTPLGAAIVGLGLNEAAYMAEIVRSGLLAVGKGQRDASAALGLTQFQMLNKVVLPQAMRVIIPPTGNQVIGMLKSTSLVSVVALSELLFAAQAIYARTFQTIPLLIVASIWYLFMTSLLTIGQSYLERKFSAGTGTRTRTRIKPKEVN